MTPLPVAASQSMPRFDWAMSLEVGEHLPTACVSLYCRLLNSVARRGLILSWAPAGQNGRCHVSGRDASWVADTFGALGWSIQRPLTARARNASRFEWLRRNTFVLVRR